MSCSPGFFVDKEDMKKSLVLFCTIFCTCFLMSVGAAGETASGDEPISLNVEQRPLGEVLAMITKITGHACIIDAQWLDMPVSVSVEATPLHKALKLIFSDINNAIIYKSDGNIKIIVYSETSEKDKGSASQKTASPPATEGESESAPEAVPEVETDNLTDTLEESDAQPGEEREPTEEKSENPDEGQDQGAEEVTD